MKGMFTTLALGTAALLFVASSAVASEDVAGVAAREAGSGSKTSAQALLRSASHRQQVAAPQSIAMDRMDSRLHGARGPVEVWVSLEQNSVAAQRAALAEASGLTTTKGAVSIKSAPSLRQGVAEHRQRILASQSALATSIAALGGREMARVQIAHNAIAVRIDASQLSQLAKLPGVAKVRPVLHYEMSLSETVPYVGGAAVQASGRDGTGVTVAVIDSGIDYTHRNFGGAGTAAAYTAAYGTSPADPRNTTRDGLFPTAKVIGGFDFVGETWGIVNGAVVGVRTEDPDPIDFQGHGSHVADIIAGRSADGSHKGMAPGASLVAIRVCSAISTSCNGISLLKALDYALDPNGDGDTGDAVDVINMSLGSDYGQIEDDLTLAATNAVKVGVVVVTSAGNGANKPYVVGSPSIAPGVISVAQTQVPSAVAIPLVINAPAAVAGVYGNTATVDWAPVGAGVTGDVAFIGRGCPADSVAGTPEDPFLASPAGKIALIDRGICSVSLKVDRAVKAGATGVVIGLVAAGDAVSFSFGGGDAFAPTLVIQQALSTRIKAQLTGGQVVNVSISPASGIPLVGSTASTSSRGPSIDGQSIKPEIGAPGASVSAEVGTGTGETAFGGTSGASPMVAGAAALLLQAYPNRSPAQIKAMLMNSAETVVYTNPALLPGELAPITRVGAGELRVDRAIGQNVIAWNTETKSAALSFGAVEADSGMVVERLLRVENLGNTGRIFTVTPSFRNASREASGAVRVLVTSTLAIPAGGLEDISVRLVIDPNKLPAWTLNGGSQGGNGAALNGVEYDGYITLTSGNQKISVPWHVLPRKAAKTVVARRSVLDPTVELRNRGADDGEYDVFSLVGVSPRVPAVDLPEPGDNFAVIDMRAVGVRYLSTAVAGGEYLEFAISTFGRRAHPNYPAEFDIYLDTTGDGVADWLIWNTENGGFSASGQNVVFLGNLATGAATAYFFADADLNSGNIIMTVPMAPMGLTPGTTVIITSVQAGDNYFTGNVTDSFADMRFTPGSARFSVAGDPFGAVPSGDSAVLQVNTASVPNTRSGELGLLMMYRRNAGREADIVRLR